MCVCLVERVSCGSGDSDGRSRWASRYAAEIIVVTVQRANF